MSDAAKWYVVHTYSGYENKVASSIEKAVENRKLHDLIQAVNIPTEKVVEVKDGKSREVERINPVNIMQQSLFRKILANPC